MQASPGPRHADRARRVIALTCLLAVAFVVVGYFLRKGSIHEPLVDLFGMFEARGYRANPGLSGAVQPGSIVQVSERSADGNLASLAQPVLFKWSSDCFPTIKPQDVPYVLPELQGTSEASLDLDAGFLKSKVPLLSLSDEIVSDYHLRLSHPRQRALAKGDASGHFSKECVDALAAAIAAGDEADWYRLVVDAIVAESIEYEVMFRDESSASARAQVADLMQSKLRRFLADKTPELKLSTDSASNRRVTMSATAEVLLAYRLRPIEIVRTPALVAGNAQGNTQ